MYEPLSYPLFFQRGENGWGVDMKRNNVPFNQYLKSRILQMDRGLYGKALLDPSFDMPCSRFQLLPRLGQVYFVDMLSRMENIKLDFIRNNQSLIRGGLADELDEGTGSAEEKEARRDSIYCPTSLTGGRRHLRQLAKNALTIVSEKGPCTEFVTLTCNANWREIQEKLLEGQDAFDRPDICAQVFHEKLRVFLINLRNGKYHGGKMRYKNGDVEGEYISREDEHPDEKVIVYIMTVIEYQHRGLPHAHIVYKISYAPEGAKRDDSEDVAKAKTEAIVRWIDGETKEFEIINGDVID